MFYASFTEIQQKPDGSGKRQRDILLNTNEMDLPEKERFLSTNYLKNSLPHPGVRGRRELRGGRARCWAPRIAAAVLALALLVLAALWLNRPEEGTPTASSQLIFVPAKVTAVLEDDAQPDRENSEGRRIGTQELEIRILSGRHKGEVLPLTNYLSALFNVDVGVGARMHCPAHHPGGRQLLRLPVQL